MDEIVVRRMTESDREAVATLLGLAFADQPNTLAVVRGDRKRASRIAADGIRIAKIERAARNFWVAEYDGRLAGALNAVEWPRCQMSMVEKLRIAPRMVLLFGSSLPRAMSISGAWAKRDPQEPHWHLGPIGVHPEIQRRGIGKAMLSSFLMHIDEHRAAAYLETDRATNLPLYELFGFRIVAEEDIIGVRSWYMWRNPVRAT